MSKLFLRSIAAMFCLATACGDGASDGPIPGSECGDGIVNEGEECDDGAANSDSEANACRTTCVLARCGDGVIDSDETCDEGEANSDVASGACRSTCEAARCGDGVVDGFEHCDLGADNSDDPGADCSSQCLGRWRFVSIPDLASFDIGDVSALTSAVNSTNAAHERALDFVLDAVAAEDPDFVLVAGDLVGGYWHEDADGVQVFGPVADLDQKAAAIEAAADTYYPQWLDRFARRDLVVHAAVGDHEIGDNDWPAGDDKSILVADYKAAWARHLTASEGAPRYAERPIGTAFEDTAYALRHKNMLLVTVDVFNQQDPAAEIGPNGSVAADVTAEQIEWLDGVLAGAASEPGIEYVVVQGHVPVIAPVRSQESSNITLSGGAQSAFWQALAAGGVDLYLAGEVHHMTASNAGGVEQICHGGLMGSDATSLSYLVGDVYPDRIELELKWIDVTADPASELWQTGSNRPLAEISLDETAGFTSAGTMVIDKSSGESLIRERTGFFLTLGESPPADLLVHLPLDDGATGKLANLGLSRALHRGLVEGAATFEAGKIGDGVTLAAGQRIVSGPTPIASNETRTVSIWVKPDPAAAGNITALTFGRNGTGSKFDIDIDVGNGGVVEVGVGRGRTDGAGTTSVTDGAWHHLAVVLPPGGDSQNDLQIYVDGQPIGVVSGDQIIATTGELGPGGGINPASRLLIGHSANSAGFQQFLGSLDDIAIWGRPLSAVEVRALVSLAESAGLSYDAGEVDALLDAFAARRDVVIDGVTWRYQAADLAGEPGQVIEVMADAYEINLGAGAGMVTP